MKKIKEIDQWLTSMHRHAWNVMSPQSRLAMLQALEHIMAAEQGRPEAQVMVIPPEEEAKTPGIMGYFDGKVIAISAKFLTPRKASILGVDHYSVGGAINTILHEGRHAWQRYIAEKGAEGVDDAMRALLLMNFENYESKEAGYGAQVIELDARRYAREQYADLLERMRTLGWEPDSVYLKQQSIDQMEENAWAESIRAELTEAQLDAWDLKARIRMARMHPEINTDGLSLFDTARKLLKGKLSVQEFIDGKSLAFADAADMRISSRLDPFAEMESEFWAALDSALDSREKDERLDRSKIRPIGKGVVF